MLALDANILVRAILRKRARSILEAYTGLVQFVVADTAVNEARSHLPEILVKRGLDPQPALAVLDVLIEEFEVVEADVYGARERDARRRLMNRDVNDWPTAAVALTFDCPVWTEDADFFGAGIATWTTDRVEIFLSSLVSGENAKSHDR
jgi:predicted nucleic acid-binding protein